MTDPTPASLSTAEPVAPTAPTPAQAAWSDRYAAAMVGLFKPARVLVRGQGCYVWDADGARYLDLLAGIAVNALGHAHPALTSALATQFATLGHVSNLFASPPQIELAERLLALVSAESEGRVFLSNSGTEANEAAIKMALRTGRPRLLALEGGFHGRTLGSLAITAKPDYRKPFEPLGPAVEFLPFGDLDALAQALAADDVAALVVEVIQGEVGVRPLPPGYLAAARELTRAHGALLIIDEVQTGIGRTGRWFAHRNSALVGGTEQNPTPINPDIVTLAKGLGGGFPIGATLALTGQAASLLRPGDHGTTFGGNPPAAAAALATLGAIESGGLVDQARDLGQTWAADIKNLGHPLIAGQRGHGLLRAIVLAQPVAPALVRAALAAGFIVNAPAPDAVRLAPPLVLTSEQAASFTAALPGLLDSLERIAP